MAALPRRRCPPTTYGGHCPGLKVTYCFVKPTKIQQPNTIFTGLAPVNDFAVYHADSISMIRAFTERVALVPLGGGKFEPPLAPDPEKFNLRMLPFTTEFKKLVRHSTRITRREFIEGYEGRKRTIYENACESLQFTRLTKKDAELKYFLKAEKHNHSKKPNAAQRIISPRSPRFNVEFGRYVKPIEKKIFTVIDKLFNSPTVMKGRNPHTRGRMMERKWKRFINPIAIGLDAKRFDQHVSTAALLWTHTIYKLFFPGDRTLQKLLNELLTQRGRAWLYDAKFKFTKEAGRCSGDMDTALGNCLLMCALVYSYASEIEVDLELANDGDDCIVIMEARDEEKFRLSISSWFLQMGISMKVEPTVTMLEKIEFCQCNPVFDGEGYVMIRDPRVAINKDAISLKPLDNISLARKWASAVSVGGTSLTGGIPVWQEFYQTLHRFSNGAKPLKNDLSMETGFFFMTKGMQRVYSEVTTASRVSFYHAFGISPDAQVAIEKYYRGVTIQYGATGMSNTIALPM